MPSSRLSEGEVVDYAKSAFGDPSAIGDNSLVAAPGLGWKIVVYGYQIVATGGANVIRFRSAANSKSPAFGFAANGGMAVVPRDIPLFECNENEALNANLTAATAVGVQLQYALVRI